MRTLKKRPPLKKPISHEIDINLNKGRKIGKKLDNRKSKKVIIGGLVPGGRW